MRSSLLLLLLLFASNVHAGTRADRSYRAGADISRFRELHSEGLSQEQQQEALVGFIESFPQSPLAELALDKCLASGLDIDRSLGDLGTVDRARLLMRYRNHHQRLARESAVLPILTENEETQDPSTQRNIKKSSR